MKNIRKGGTIVLNMDDNFYSFHKNFALKKKLNIISFSIYNKSSTVRLYKINKKKDKYKLFIKIRNLFLIQRKLMSI